jgi:hypothetical protein
MSAEMDKLDMSGRLKVQVDYYVISDTENFTNAYEKLVYVILCKYANWSTKEAFPSVGTIAKEAFCSENTVRKALRSLRDIGLIAIEPQNKSSGGQTSNLYVLLDIPESFARGSPHEGGGFTS